MKPERNKPCPCGSGKKYKKCCIPKYDQPIAPPIPPKKIWGPGYSAQDINEFFSLDKSKEDVGSLFTHLWDLEDLEAMSDAEILDKLDELGMPVTKEQFLQDIESQYDIEPVVKLWETRYSVQCHEIEGRDADFPFLAVWELWRRWKPDQYGIHMLDDLIKEMVESEGEKDVFPEYVRFWKILKEQIILPHQVRSLDELVDRFDWYYDLKVVFLDLDFEYMDTFLNDKVHGKERIAELISLYEDMLHTLPDSDLHTIQSIRRSIAQAHFYLGNEAKGEELFEQLIQDYPHWAGGYTGWGDMYLESTFLSDIYNEEKAMEIYRMGLSKCEEDKEEIEERLRELE